MRRLNNTSAFSAINVKLGESIDNVPSEVQVLRVGKFNHPQYGFFEITEATLSEMKNNFDAKVRGIDTAFDYYHKSDEEAAAWVGGLDLRENGKELWAVNVGWTPKARRMLADREVRYFSPDFAFKWIDPESGKQFSNVLFGGGLTNRPFVKEMAAIVADENLERGNNMTELEKAQAKLKELEAQNVKLSEDKAKLEEQVKAAAPASEMEMLKAENEKLKQELEAMKAQHAQMMEQSKKDQEAKVMAEKEKEFQVMLSEGKAVAAQKDAWMKGDIAGFAKLSQPVNLNGNGTVNGGKEGTREDRILKLAEKKVEESKGTLSFGDAVSAARKEIKE